jgi:hypothetical protein
MAGNAHAFGRTYYRVGVRRPRLLRREIVRQRGAARVGKGVSATSLRCGAQVHDVRMRRILALV